MKARAYWKLWAASSWHLRNGPIATPQIITAHGKCAMALVAAVLVAPNLHRRSQTLHALRTGANDEAAASALWLKGRDMRNRAPATGRAALVVALLPVMLIAVAPAVHCGPAAGAAPRRQPHAQVEDLVAGDSSSSFSSDTTGDLWHAPQMLEQGQQPPPLLRRLQQLRCGPGTHRCGMQCVPNTDVTTCGKRCTPCPAPASGNGVATCSAAGACGISCRKGFQAGRECATPKSCKPACKPLVCSAGMQANARGNGCVVCAPNTYKPRTGLEPCRPCPGRTRTLGRQASDHDSEADCLAGGLIPSGNFTGSSDLLQVLEDFESVFDRSRNNTGKRGGTGSGSGNKKPTRRKTGACLYNCLEYDGFDSRQSINVAHLAGSPAVYRSDNSTDVRAGVNLLGGVIKQGSCQTCVSAVISSAATAAVAAALRVDAHLLSPLSYEYSYWCGASYGEAASGRACETGWDLGEALKSMTTHHVAFSMNSSCFERGVDFSKLSTPASLRAVCNAATTACKQAWFRCTSVFLSNIPRMQRHIRKYGSVASRIQVTAEFNHFFEANRTGVYNGSVADGEEVEWHAVLLIGYNNTGMHWIARNSWGTDWGDQGTFRIAYGALGVGHPEATYGLECNPTSSDAATLAAWSDPWPVTADPKAPGCYLYEARNRDTISGIADHFGVDILDLVERNTRRNVIPTELRGDPPRPEPQLDGPWTGKTLQVCDDIGSMSSRVARGDFRWAWRSPLSAFKFLYQSAQSNTGKGPATCSSFDCAGLQFFTAVEADAVSATAVAHLAGAPAAYRSDNLADVRSGVNLLGVVYDQGACSTCVSHVIASAGTAAVAAALRVDASSLVPVSHDAAYHCLPIFDDISPQRSCGTGWSFESAFASMQEYPAAFFMNRTCLSGADLTQLSYSRSLLFKTCTAAKDACGVASFKCKAVVLSSIWDFQRHIRLYGAVLTPMRVTKRFLEFSTANPTGVFSSSPSADEDVLYHAVLLVGYNNTGYYWIARNSWGPDWADGGTFRIAYGALGIGHPEATYGLECSPTSSDAATLAAWSDPWPVAVDPDAPGCHLYTATNRDTISGIADHFGVDILDLVERNTRRGAIPTELAGDPPRLEPQLEGPWAGTEFQLCNIPLQLLDHVAIVVADQTHTFSVNDIGYTLHVAPKRDWQGAGRRCQQDGQHLARLYSRPQGAKLAAAVTAFAQEPFWIGLSDTASEGSWVWSVDSSMLRLNGSWTPGQPDGGRAENCAVATPEGGAWMDVPCDARHAFVCMGDAASLAAAAAAAALQEGA